MSKKNHCKAVVDDLSVHINIHDSDSCVVVLQAYIARAGEGGRGLLLPALLTNTFNLLHRQQDFSFNIHIL